MIQKKRICLVIPSLQAGGMERVMSELARYFSVQPEAELHIVLYGITRDIFYPVPEGAIIHIPEFRFNNKFRLIFTSRTLTYLRSELKKINPDTVLSFGEYWNNFVLLASLGLKYPLFVSDRSQPDKSLGRFHDLLRKWLYPRAKGLILQTQKAKEIYLRKNRHSNIAVIGNPIRDIDIDKQNIKRENIVLMVGRLIRSKNQDRLISIFSRVNHPAWKLIIAGYDHLKQKNLENLKKLSEDLGIAERVKFLGKVDNVEELYARSSVFAFTSSSEGFPNVVGEAMSASLPVVAYDCVAGPSEMIKDNLNGYLVPLFDDQLFETRLAELMNNSELRSKMGSNARESIKKFSNDEICKAFYTFILGNAGITNDVRSEN